MKDNRKLDIMIKIFKNYKSIEGKQYYTVNMF